ncbi:protein STU1 [Podospora australis]|uniref:Protein STU1 n=1 Tax=Podospora australis TaxID=1536484 RepID=A0AAN7APL3_9PEZI|nr:protein STU1 [Podospora australis]
MAERVSEKQVEDLIAILRTDVPVDAKVSQVTAVKSSIKQHNVGDTCISPLFEALHTASTSQHAILANAGFTALIHLLTRLDRQNHKSLRKEAPPQVIPVLIEKLGDQKDKLRHLAIQGLSTLYKHAAADVERAVRNTAMVGKNARAKEASLHWLLQMHQEQGLQFRGYVPTLMDLLEDADGMVREAAKSTVIELFKNAPNAAKSDLKKQLKNFKIRPAIEQAIVKELIPGGSAPASQTAASEERPASRQTLTASASTVSIDRPITPGLDAARAETVEPMYVNTKSELEEIFREMHLYFDGRETEQNWLKREESMTKLRKLLAGNGPEDFHEPFVNGIRALLDGIIKAVISLRTSLSKEGCNLVQDVARVFGPAMDPMVELLMQTFIKLAAATKKIASQQANVTVDAIISRATYTPRIMQHIWLAVQDKNVQPRLYSTGWLQTIITKEAHHKHHIEHSGGLDLIEKSIKKGLGDANPGVREKMRATYWKFTSVWPARAEAIMDGLDSTAQKLLRNDPHNPSSPKRQPAAGGARPGLGLSKSTMGAPPKPSVREAMMAQKKALAASSKTMPQRPGSAMSHFSPMRMVSGSSHASTATTTTTTSTVRTRPESAVMGSSGGISGAPMRPGRKRPEMAARPATAGPYSVRSGDGPSVEQTSPPDSKRPKSAATPKPITSSPKRTAPKTGRPCPNPGESVSGIPTPTKATTPKFASPRSTPSRMSGIFAHSPPRTNEDLAASVPAISIHKSTSSQDRQYPQQPVEVVGHAREVPQHQEEPDIARRSSPEVVLRSVEESKPTSPRFIEPPPTATSPTGSLKVYEDPFTEDERPPKPTFEPPVLEDKAVNEDAANIPAAAHRENGEANGILSPEKTKQNLRLLESGIAKVKQQSLDVHGFRKLQSIIRDSKSVITDDKFDTLLSGLFEFLEAPLTQVPAEKVQDVKAQVLATIKVLLKKMRSNFQPHVSRGLESLLRARATYEGRTHMVSGLELLASELVTLGDASEIALVLSRMLSTMDVDAPAGSRSLSMGLHVLKEMMDARGAAYVPADTELEALASLASRCLESLESAVRMDAVLLCVALHARVGDVRFWEAVKEVKEDPKSLITYYIVRRQREQGIAPTTATAA